MLDTNKIGKLSEEISKRMNGFSLLEIGAALGFVFAAFIDQHPDMKKSTIKMLKFTVHQLETFLEEQEKEKSCEEKPAENASTT